MLHSTVDVPVVCCSSVDAVLRKMVDQDEFAMSAFINELLVLVGLIKVGCVWVGVVSLMCVVGRGLLAWLLAIPHLYCGRVKTKSSLQWKRRKGH